MEHDIYTRHKQQHRQQQHRPSRVCTLCTTRGGGRGRGGNRAILLLLLSSHPTKQKTRGLRGLKQTQTAGARDNTIPSHEMCKSRRDWDDRRQKTHPSLLRRIRPVHARGTYRVLQRSSREKQAVAGIQAGRQLANLGSSARLQPVQNITSPAKRAEGTNEECSSVYTAYMTRRPHRLQ